GRAILIVSPALAAARAARKEPAPLSAAEVTVIVAAWLCRAQSKAIEPPRIFLRQGRRRAALFEWGMGFSNLVAAKFSIILRIPQPDFESQGERHGCGLVVTARRAWSGAIPPGGRRGDVDSGRNPTLSRSRGPAILAFPL